MLPVAEILQTAVGHSREILFIRQEGRRNREKAQKGRGKELVEARTQASNGGLIAPENGLSCRAEHIDSLFQYCPKV